MALQKPIRDRDLSDPVERPGQSAALRRRITCHGLSLFIGAYSLLHKLLLPLDVTPLFLLPWIYLEARRHEAPRLRSFLAAVFVVQALQKAHAVFVSGEISGWPAFSHLLSSWPLAACALAQLTWANRSLAGLATGGLLALGLALFSLERSMDELARPLVLSKPSRPMPPSAPPPCAAQTLTVVAAARPDTPEVRLEDCGLAPSVAALGRASSLTLSNRRKENVQLHFYAYANGAFVRSWNVLLKRESQSQSPAIHLKDNEVGLLFSDSLPELGLVALIGSQSFAQTRAWNFSRQPLRVERQP